MSYILSGHDNLSANIINNTIITENKNKLLGIINYQVQFWIQNSLLKIAITTSVKKQVKNSTYRHMLAVHVSQKRKTVMKAFVYLGTVP